MDIHWWFIQLLKPALAIVAGVALPKCILPLKKGIKEENQKLVNKGMTLLMAGVFAIILAIYCMWVA